MESSSIRAFASRTRSFTDVLMFSTVISLAAGKRHRSAGGATWGLG